MLKNTSGVSEASKYLMRSDKPFTVIPWRKQEEEKQRFRCKIRGCRLLETVKGYYCPIGCGPTYAATRTAFTFMKKNPSSLRTQELRQKDVK
jgi:hypothetical protein